MSIPYLIIVKKTLVCLPPGSTCSLPVVPRAFAVKKSGQEIKVKERPGVASFLIGGIRPFGYEQSLMIAIWPRRKQSEFR